MTTYEKLELIEEALDKLCERKGIEINIDQYKEEDGMLWVELYWVKHNHCFSPLFDDIWFKARYFDTPDTWEYKNQLKELADDPNYTLEEIVVIRFGMALYSYSKQHNLL